MRVAALMLLVAATLSPLGARALTLTEVPNPHAQPLEGLARLGVIRGQRIADKRLHVDAMAGEAWTLAITGLPGAQAVPSSGTGALDVTLRFTQTVTTDTFTGTIELRDAMAMAQSTLMVVGELWPKVGSLTRDDVKSRTNWPSDPDFHDRWDLFGFMPDATSHPGRTFQVETWEKTACTTGTDRQPGCTQEGQAGLASGMSADRAWGLTVGDKRVTLAVLDSGARWHNRDVIGQVRLNADELLACPPPGATAGDVATYDVNHDGFFSIRDYDDATLEDWNMNGVRDPQDLIQGTLGGVACSNGSDEDQNGYTDDIAGWDFFWDDNDPSDDADFGHGDFEARLSTGQGHNGISGIGVCPGCSVIPLRVGDSFIVDVNRYAAAVMYAVDNDVSVVQQALGGLNNTPSMHRAVDYAYQNGVPVIAAASDLLSYHHNWPANAAHAFMVHAIVFNAQSGLGGPSSDWWDATTFLNFNNCTNYGAKLMLSSPGEGCSSEATAKTAGHAGMIQSYFRQLRDRNPGDAYFAKDLSAEEVYQLLIAGADDIDVPGAEQDPEALTARKFPSNEGFDEHFGYGRNNVYRSLKILEEKRIPPEVDITAPHWFDFVRVRRDIESNGEIEVRARVQHLRGNADVTYHLRWARGVEPKAADFHDITISSNVVAGGGVQSVKALATIPLSDLMPPEMATLPRDHADRMITLQLTATTGNSAVGIARRSFFVEEDTQLRDGFPMYLGASGEASPKFADINQDGRQELIVVTADGYIHALNNDARNLIGFPVHLIATDGTCGRTVFPHQETDAIRHGAVTAETAAGTVSSPAIARFGQEKTLSIVAATTGGAVFVFDSRGQIRPGFPVCLDLASMDSIRLPVREPQRRRRAEMGFYSSPTVVDLEGDGVEDIILGGGDGQLHVWLPDGTIKAGFPVVLHHPLFGDEVRHDDRLVSSPTIADLDGDGIREVVIGSNERFDNEAQSALYAVRANGNEHPDGPFPIVTSDGGVVTSWPQRVNMFTGEELLPTIGRGHPTSVAAADVDGDGKDEVVTAGIGSYVTVYKIDGPLEATMPFSGTDFGAKTNSDETAVLTMMASPSIADLDLDGKPDVIDGMLGAAIAGLVSQGGERIEFDHVIGAWDIGSATFLDGFPQTVSDYQILMNYPVADVNGDGKPEVIVGTSGYFLHAFNFEGTVPAGFPKLTGGFNLATSAMGDLDGDDKIELAAITRDGWLFLWDLEGPSSSIQWAGFKHDARNTGNVKTLPDDPPRAKGCSCEDIEAAAGDARTEGENLINQIPLAVGLLLFGASRRRRRRKE